MSTPRAIASLGATGTVLLTLLPGPAVGEPPTGASHRGARTGVGAPGIGDRYWPLDGNGGIDVRHYDVRVGYDFATGRLEGVTTLTLRAKRDLTRFDLDLLLPASAATVGGVPAGLERPSPHELQITPVTPLARGQQVKVTVEYAGVPGSIGYAGERNWLADDYEVVTMNQPHMAPWWFPANDHPTDKATYDVTVTGPATHQVVSNGLPVGRTTAGDLATTHWRSRSPMASYLAFFALGRFQVERGVRDGRPWYVAVSNELDDDSRRASMRALRRSPAITEWLEDRLGSYPFGSTGGLVTSLRVGFALENQTRPTYPSLGGDTSLLVHELAHQWFGDSVSVRRWRDIWLNEGFATFMEVAYAERHGGRTGRQWLRRQYAEKQRDAGFWRLDLADPGPGRIFDYPIYLRGAMTLQALRQRIGDRDFWRLLHVWVRGRRYGHGSVAAFEKLAARVSKERLGPFFRGWLRSPRPPTQTRSNGLR